MKIQYAWSAIPKKERNMIFLKKAIKAGDEAYAVSKVSPVSAEVTWLS